MHLKDKSDESFISINCLEYVTIILNYCASLVCLQFERSRDSMRSIVRMHRAREVECLMMLA